MAKDGTAGINFEHSWGDGVAILRLFNELYKDTIDRPFCHPDDVAASSESNADDSSNSVFLVGNFPKTYWTLIKKILTQFPFK